MLTLIEWKDFLNYYLKHCRSDQTIVEVKRFIITLVALSVGIILVASLVIYSVWNIITVILISLIAYHAATIFIDWRIKNNYYKDREKVYESVTE